MTKISAALATALVLATGLGACETATPYQPAVRGSATSGGYSETRIEPNRWRVNFAGNSMTSRETVEGYLLFRAAELTLQNGDNWFAIVDRQTDRNARTYVEPDPLYHPWYGPGFGYWRPSWRFRAPGTPGSATPSGPTGWTSRRSRSSRPPPRSSRTRAPSPPMTRAPSTPARWWTT